MKCEIPGCTRANYKARGLCAYHYQWARLSGRLGSFERKTRPVTGRVCDVEGCDSPVKKTGGKYCRPHARTEYQNKPPTVRPCAVDECQRNRHAGGTYCSMHAERLRRTGELGPVGPKVRLNNGALCSVDGCERPADSRGYCLLHYQRAKTTGEPGPAGLKRRPSGEGSIELGYRSFAVDGKRQREHRMIWEAANGPIPDGYVIHHKNGDKLDNRLENLQMMTRQEHRAHHHDDLMDGRRK